MKAEIKDGILLLTVENKEETKSLEDWMNSIKLIEDYKYIHITQFTDHTFAIVSNNQDEVFKCAKCEDTNYIQIGTIIVECECMSESDSYKPLLVCLNCNAEFKDEANITSERLVHFSNGNKIQGATSGRIISCPACNQSELKFKQ